MPHAHTWASHHCMSFGSSRDPSHRSGLILVVEAAHSPLSARVPRETPRERGNPAHTPRKLLLVAVSTAVFLNCANPSVHWDIRVVVCVWRRLWVLLAAQMRYPLCLKVAGSGSSACSVLLSGFFCPSARFTSRRMTIRSLIISQQHRGVTVARQW